MEKTQEIIFDISNRNNSSENLKLLNNFFPKDNTPIVIKAFDEKLTKEEFSVLNNLYKNNPKSDIKVDVYHKKLSGVCANKIWELSTVLDANKFINDVCNVIKSKKLSPMEALAYIHICVQKVVPYNASKVRSWCSNDQFFVGAFLKNTEFVCAGYSSLENEIIKSLNFENLSSKQFSCKFTMFDGINKQPENHSRLQIYVDDKKYNIKGHFYSDPTWDITNKTDAPKFCHLLMSKSCHEFMSRKFDYFEFYISEKTKSGEVRDTAYYPEFEFLDEQSKPQDQLVMEKIIFNTLSKITSKSFDKLYNTFCDIISTTYDEQIDKKMVGSFNSKVPLLSKNDAKQIFENYNKNTQNLEKNDIFY